jgi:hypothetical protein
MGGSNQARRSHQVVQGDGNLVLHAPGNRPIWASGSQGGAPAKPDIVHVGREILSMGYAVAGHSKFPPVGRHTPTSWHYKDRALDINWYPGSDEGPSWMTSMVGSSGARRNAPSSCGGSTAITTTSISRSREVGGFGICCVPRHVVGDGAQLRG